MRNLFSIAIWNKIPEIRFENTKDNCRVWNGAITVNDIFKEIGSNDAELTDILKVVE